jgi:hypothetical protein
VANLNATSTAILFPRRAWFFGKKTSKVRAESE